MSPVHAESFLISISRRRFWKYPVCSPIVLFKILYLDNFKVCGNREIKTVDNLLISRQFFYLWQSYPMPGKVKVVQIIPENNERNVQILVFSPFSNSINRLHRLDFFIAVGTANLCYYLARSGEMNSRRCKVNISMPGKSYHVQDKKKEKF